MNLTFQIARLVIVQQLRVRGPGIACGVVGRQFLDLEVDQFECLFCDLGIDRSDSATGSPR